MDGERPENTHNDVRGDDDVEVRDPKASEQGNHQPDKEGRHYEGRSTENMENVCGCWGHHGASGGDGIHAA